MKNRLFMPKILAGISAVATIFALVFSASPAFAYADTTPPSVGAITPTSAQVGVPTLFFVNYSDDVGVTYCGVTEYPNQTFLGAMQLSNNQLYGTGSLSVAFQTQGSHSVQASCRDAAGNWGTSAMTSIIVGASVNTNGNSPSVGPVSPSNVTLGQATSFSASFSDQNGVTQCDLMDSNGNVLTTSSYNSIQSGTAYFTYTFNSSGSQNLHVRCRDVSGYYGVGPYTTVTVASPANDTSAPLMGQLTPQTATAGTTFTISASYSDSNGVTECQLTEGQQILWDSGTIQGSPTNGSASVTYSYPIAGTHQLQMKCSDYAGNWGYSPVATFYVYSQNSYNNGGAAPTVGSVSPQTAIYGNPIYLQASYSNSVGVTYCEFYDGSTNVGSVSPGGYTNGTASVTVNYLSVGAHNMTARCRDSVGNWGYSPNSYLVVSSQSGSNSYDYTGPSVGLIQQTSAQVGIPTLLTAPVSDNIGLNSCTLYVDGNSQGTMSISNGYASRSYTFPWNKNYNIYVNCSDTSGNSTSGNTQTVYASGYSYAYNGLPGPGSLLKITCPAYHASDDPCTAVYYYGTDGKRHPFPNSRVYSTWYSDFSAVQEVSDIYMAQIPLGKNVTYKPGVKMVKFTTVNKVYAVGQRGVLHWITSEDVARSLYGSYWNQQIDDIPDVFYSNYTFGTDITYASQFVPWSEMSNASSIDANF